MKNNIQKTVILFYPLVEKDISNQNISWALLYLERNLRDLDINLILIDERLNNNFEEIIIEHKDDLILAGISCMIGYQLVGALKFTEMVKKHSKAHIIWGGWFPTVFTDMVLKEKDIDYLAIGQGEESLKNLIIALLNNNPGKQIKGIINKSSEITKEYKENLANFESLPPLNLDIFDINKIIDKDSVVETGYRGTDYLATIGCPYKCAFCNLTYIFGQKWYPKNVERIISDLKVLVEKGNLSQITFSDDNFFVSKSFVIEFCDQLIESGLNIKWEANTHVKSFLKLFNENDIQKIKDSGCVRIKIGAESGDQDILDLINKKTLVEDNLQIIRVLKKFDIGVRYYTMVAFPHNPDKDLNKTLKLIAAAKIIYSKMDFNINVFKPIPKTDIFPLAQSFGFDYPDTIDGLLKLLENELLFPWHKRNYYKILEVFTEVYIPSLNLNFHKELKGNRTLNYLLNLYFHINTRFRTKTGLWQHNAFARYALKRIKQSQGQTPTENVAIIKSR